jgi:SAM-dependent methyltransferase
MAFDLFVVDLRSQQDFERWAIAQAATLRHRRAVEEALDAAYVGDGPEIYCGYCWICARHSHFTYDRNYAREGRMNWRERLVCTSCGLANRLRLSVHVMETLLPNVSTSSVYLTEQLTPLARSLRERIEQVTCSEYVGDATVGGTVDWRGLRHEDLTHLSFEDRQFDVVLSFDVLEHVPDYRKALQEIRRVLKPEGYCFITAPFGTSLDRNLVRAEVENNGEVRHLLPPEYHGDPLNPGKGALCYYTFGWELLDNMRASGFADAFIRFSWSSDYAYLGPELPIVIGRA